MQRVFWKVTLLFVLLAVLGACAAPTVAPSAAVTAPADEKILLEFWTLSEGDTSAYIDSIVAGFNAVNPGVEVVLRTYAPEAYKTAIQVAIGSDDPPDILFNWAGDDTGRYVREGQLLDLTPYGEKLGWFEHVSPAVLNAFTYDGVLAGAAYSLEAKYFYYNKEMFAKEGLSVPASFDELLTLCKVLREKGYTPMSFGNQDRWEGVHYLSIFNQKVVGEKVIEEDYTLASPADQLFADPNYAQAFQKLLDMQNAGCFGDAVNSTTPDAAIAQFYSEQVPMYYQGTWAMGQLKAAEFDKPYGLFRMPPVTDGAGNQNYVLMGPIALEVSAKSAHPDEAVAFVDHFISQANQQRLVDELNRLGVRNDLDTSKTSEGFQFVIADLAKAEGSTTWLDVVLENSVSEVYLNVIQEVLAGTKTPEEAADAVREQALIAKERLGK